jgi:predicted dehydrogenase
MVAAADINSEAVRDFAKEFDIPARYTDYGEMLEGEELDIVSVCTWPLSHAEITIAAAESGVKGILCEKPMATNLGEADAMLEACDRNEVKLVVGHQRRFEPINITARKLILEGAIGQPTLAFRKASGGLLNWGTHLVDTIRYLLGDPETLWVLGQVSRKTDRYERRMRIEDFSAGIICFEGGTRGVIEVDLPGPGMPAALMYGSDGMMTYHDGRIFLIGKKGAVEIQPRGDGMNQLDELIAWIEGRVEEHRGSGRQARYTMEIMMAIYESVRIRDVVRMPLQIKESPLELMIREGILKVERPGRYDIRVPFEEQQELK